MSNFQTIEKTNVVIKFDNDAIPTLDILQFCQKNSNVEEYQLFEGSISSVNLISLLVTAYKKTASLYITEKSNNTSNIRGTDKRPILTVAVDFRKANIIQCNPCVLVHCTIKINNDNITDISETEYYPILNKLNLNENITDYLLYEGTISSLDVIKLMSIEHSSSIITEDTNKNMSIALDFRSESNF